MTNHFFQLFRSKTMCTQHFLKRISYSLTLGLLFGNTAPSYAQTMITFSIDPASPSIEGSLTPDDVLVEGPAVFIEGTELGLIDEFFDGFFDNLNALSYGKDPIKNPLYFSVDRVAIGLPDTDVHAESEGGDAAGDVYKTLPPFGNNSLVIDEEKLGLEGGFFGDDLDALDLDTPAAPELIYFSVDYLSFPNLEFQDDILVSERDGTFYQYADGAGNIGIDEEDDLDALILWDVVNPGQLDPGIDMALFSLNTFSPSTFTFTGNEYIPGVKEHLSPADVLFTNFTGSFSLWASAPDIGLFPDDELDALDTIPVPEPSAVLGILVASGLGMIGRNKKNSR